MLQRLLRPFLLVKETANVSPACALEECIFFGLCLLQGGLVGLQALDEQVPVFQNLFSKGPFRTRRKGRIEAQKQQKEKKKGIGDADYLDDSSNDALLSGDCTDYINT